MAQRITHKSRKPSGNNSHHAANEVRREREFDETSESDDMHDDDGGYLAEGAAQVRELARGHEMQAVVTALAAGFSIGILLGGVIGGSRRREMVDENMMRRMLSGMQKMMPEAVSKHFKT